MDEFQDTNKLQYKWIRMLAGTNGVKFGQSMPSYTHIAVVGDTCVTCNMQDLEGS